MVRTVMNLTNTDLGYRIAGVVRARVVPPGPAYPDAPTLMQFYEELIDRLAAPNTPIAVTNWPPFAEPASRAVLTDAGTAGAAAGVMAVSPQYFATLGITLVGGRGFGRADRLGSDPVALVSASLARELWGAGDAIGQRIRTTDGLGYQAPVGAWRTVVGVVRDVRQTYTDSDVRDIYIPFSQAPSRFAPLYIRSDRPASFWLETLRSAVAQLNPEVTINGANLLQSEADRQLASRRFLTALLTGFSFCAVFLATLGIYGVMAYTVEHRRHEIAIRMAIGATRSAVVRHFIRQGAVVLGGGIACGLLGSWAVSRVLTSQLHGVQPFDVATILATSALMSAIGLLAAWWPAHRAARRSPVLALKES
jgi:predicted permease